MAVSPGHNRSKSLQNIHIGQPLGTISCPFATTNQYLELRGDYNDDEEALFIFRDGSLVKPSHLRRELKSALINLNLDPEMYGTHSLHIGRATDMMKANYTIEQIKQAGRWKSNCVYKYIHC